MLFVNAIHKDNYAILCISVEHKNTIILIKFH
jgi:hypothetical protein